MRPVWLSFKIAAGLAVLSVLAGFAIGYGSGQIITGARVTLLLLLVSFLFSLVCNVLLYRRGYLKISNVLIWILACLWGPFFPVFYIGLLFVLGGYLREIERGENLTSTPANSDREDSRMVYMFTGAALGSFSFLAQHFTKPMQSGQEQFGTMISLVLGGYGIGYLLWLVRDRNRSSKKQGM